MHEEDFREFIQTLSKRLMPKLDQLKTAQERVAFVLDQPETKEMQKTIIARGGVEGSGSWQFGTKNAELAKRNREDGNAAFQVGFKLSFLIRRTWLCIMGR